MKWNGNGYDETDINLEKLSELIDLLMLYVWSVRCQKISMSIPKETIKELSKDLQSY